MKEEIGMYMDEKDTRSPRDRVDGELLRRLLGENSHTDGQNDCGCETDVHDTSHRNPHESACSRRTTCAVEREVHRALTDRNLHPHHTVNGQCGPSNVKHTCLDGCDQDTHACPENGINGRSLAMVYAPVQQFQQLYDPQTGLGRGTVFRELDLPFRGDGISARGGNCRGY